MTSCSSVALLASLRLQPGTTMSPSCTPSSMWPLATAWGAWSMTTSWRSAPTDTAPPGDPQHSFARLNGWDACRALYIIHALLKRSCTTCRMQPCI